MKKLPYGWKVSIKSGQKPKLFEGLFSTITEAQIAVHSYLMEQSYVYRNKHRA